MIIVTSSEGDDPFGGKDAYGAWSANSGSDPYRASRISFSGETSISTSGYQAYGLYASAGGTISSTNPLNSVATTGLDANGVQADTGGVIVMTGGSVTTSGVGASGLFVTGASSAITASGVLITTGAGLLAQPDGVGVFADNGGIATLNGGSVTTSGANAAGLWASGSGATITTNPLAGAGAAIVTKGDNSPGAEADTGGAVILNGGSVTTSGASAAGVTAVTGGSAALSGVSISTSGQDSLGLAVVGSGSQASLAGANVVDTSGDGAVGLLASQGGALTSSGTTSVTTSGGIFATTGLGAYGVNADGAGSTVSLSSATVKTSGAGAVGLLASDRAGSGAAGSITVTGPLNVQTTNPAAVAIALQGSGARVLATGGGTIASAGGAIAFLGGANQIATFDNFTIANQSGDLIFADPSVATVNFNGTTANAGTNALLNATGGSVVTLNASASALTGAIRTDSASTSTLNLTSGANWTMTGSSVLSNLAVSASYVVFAAPTASAGFKTLTLQNYAGSGGFVTMNATLGGTGSASDQIVINGGRATGSTLLTIRNVSGAGALTIGAGIPVIVAVNGGTIATNAFALANTPVVGGYRYELEQSGQDLYLVSTPAATQAQMANSVTNVAKAQQQALITGRVLGSILLGATEQVNCSNCSSGFGSIGSYALGAHGRTSLSPELTAMGGFSYNEYSAQGITVTNAPTFGGSLVYDPINFGGSRPFFEIGGGLVPFEQVRYTRTYPNGAQVGQGQGNGINRSLGLFARVGWVDRVTPIDEAAVYTDVSRSWMVAGGYSEASGGNNPFPATVSTGLETLDVLRLGAQYTHLFGGRYEANVSGAVAYGFSAVNSAQWNVADYGSISPYPIGNSVWCEWGARVGYRFSQRMVVDAFLIGTLGGQIGTTVHGGIGLRYLF